jgi:chemotaxis protein histidine kinase CheA
MTLDLAQFHDAFFDESFEALDTMEAALLKLNVGAPEPEIVNTIFRVAHSIKGGSATFGFADVASFTHTCETLLDELRGNRMQVTRAITDLLLKSVDIMREMLRAVQHKQPVDAQRQWYRRKLRRSPRQHRQEPSVRRPCTAGESSSVRIRNCSRMATIRCACCVSWRISVICT